MHWHWADDEQELIISDSTEEQRANVAEGIANLRKVGKDGETTGYRLHQAVESGCLSWEIVKSLSSWCDSEGKFKNGVKPAQVVSRAFFNGQVLPRLTTLRKVVLTDRDARQRFEKFAETAGIWSDRIPIQAQSEPHSVSEKSGCTTDQTKPAITYKLRPVSDYPSLVGSYSDSDLASPSRSTVPLLAYWSGLEQRFADFAAALGIEWQDTEVFGFEYTVPVQQGKGKASYTDLMLLSRYRSIAIEAKYTEPPYLIVRDWLGSSPSSNRESVLTGWLSLINSSTGSVLEISDVLDCTYQLIHRTASACELHKQGQTVIYQCFDPTQKLMDYYYLQLSHLSRLINRPERISFFLFAVSLLKSSEYQRLQDAWTAGNRDLSTEVRQGLILQSLLDFRILTVRQA